MEQMMESIFIEILNISLTASVIIVALFFIRVLLKKAPRIYTYALWAIVLFRLLCPVSFESNVSLLGVLQNESAVEGHMEYISQDIGYQLEPEIHMPIEVVDNVVNNSLPEGNPQGSVNPLQVVLYLVVRIWILGIAVLVIYSAVSIVKFQKLLKKAVWEKDNIYRIKGKHSPFVYGVFGPCIYLPDHLEENELEYVILHEQIHIKRGDHIYRLLAYLALCIHWFNPLVWAAFSFSGRDMEISCDEAVIRKMGSKVKKEYSMSLLNLTCGDKIVKGIPVAFGESDTANRIKHVLKYKKHAKMFVKVTAIVCAIVAVMLIANPADRGYSVYGIIGYGDMFGEAEENERMQRVVALTSGDVYIPGTDDIIPLEKGGSRELEVGDLVKISFAEKEVGILETYPGQFSERAKTIEVLGKGYSLEYLGNDLHMLSVSLDVAQMADIGDKLEMYHEEKLLVSSEIERINEDTNELFIELTTNDLKDFFNNFESGIKYQLLVQEKAESERSQRESIRNDLNPENPEDGTYYLSARSISRSARGIDRYASENMEEERPALGFADYCVFLVNKAMAKELYEAVSFDEFADLVNDKKENVNASCIVTFENGLIVEAKLKSEYFNYGINYQPIIKNTWEEFYEEQNLEKGEKSDIINSNIRETVKMDIGDGKGEEIIEVSTGSYGQSNVGIVDFKSAQGTWLYSESAFQFRAGWNNIYLGEAEGVPYILTVHIEDREENGVYSYQVFRLDRYGEILQIAGSQFEWGETFFYDDQLFTVWVSDLEYYLENSFLILSSQEGEIRIEQVCELEKYNYETLKRE